MKLAEKLCLGALLLLPVLADEKPRVMFGVVPDAALVQDGLAVRAVRPASPAQVAGLQVGDVIVALNGTAVSSKEEMSAVLQRLAPGDVLRVEVLQNGACEEIPSSPQDGADMRRRPMPLHPRMRR